MFPGVGIPSRGIPDRYPKLFHVSIHSRFFLWFFRLGSLTSCMACPHMLGGKVTNRYIGSGL